MKHFKISLITGKKFSCSRTLYVKALNASEALSISYKVRYSKLTYLKEIGLEEYMKGISKKYTNN